MAKFDETLVISIEKQTKDRLEDVAGKEHRSVAGQARVFIEDGLARVADSGVLDLRTQQTKDAQSAPTPSP